MTSPAVPPSKRVSTRRGSTSASDPFGKNALINTHSSRASASTLTIVRVLSPPATHAPQHPVPHLGDPIAQRRFQSHRRIGSNPSTSGPPQNQIDSPTRVSFAFSSFGAHAPQSSSSAVPSSPTSSPRLRPSSPARLNAPSLALNKPRLTPDQLVELARQSVNPPFAPAYPPSQSGHHSPAQHHPAPSIRQPRPFSPSNFRPSSPSSPVPPVAPTTAPATFTLLPDDIYLPFIDRPAEVAALISTPPSYKLFQLLAQTFSKHDEVANEVDPDQPPTDPTKWTYQHLHAWLTRVDRAVAPDPLWVLKARKCVLSHSELIWERIKGALGVPPELDIDLDIDALEAGGYDSGSSIHTEDISDDEGRKARGHWDDWDAIMDSPVFERDPHILGSPHGPSHVNAEEDSGEQTVSPTPAGEGSPGEAFRRGLDDESGQPLVSIEPILTTDIVQTPLPIGDDGGLGDIAEGAEEEEEDANDSKKAGEAPAAAEPDPHLVHPSNIQGLKITTPLLPAEDVIAAVNIGSPIATTAPGLPPHAGSVTGHSRSPSVGSLGSLGSGFLKRSDSFGSVLSIAPSGVGLMGPAGGSLGRSSIFASVIDDTPYDSIGDRSAGSPLFPSNFAKLASAPTLVPNKHTRIAHSTAAGPGSPSGRNSPVVGYPIRVGSKMRTFSHGATAAYAGRTGTTPKSGSVSPIPGGVSSRFSVRRGSEGAPSTGIRMSPFAPLAKKEGASAAATQESSSN